MKYKFRQKEIRLEGCGGEQAKAGLVLPGIPEYRRLQNSREEREREREREREKTEGHADR